MLLAVGILMVIGAGAYWYFVDDPQNTELQTKIVHIDSLNAQNQRAKAQLARGSVAKIKAEADSMRANLELFRTLVPAGSEVPSGASRSRAWAPASNSMLTTARASVTARAVFNAAPIDMLT